MVCIAAFIILILVGVIIAFLSIFNRNLGRKYLKVLKKSWHCFSRRISFRKCDTNFSDDVKSLLLKKVALKRPKLVKPLSVGVEIASVLIVVITAWSLVESIKSGLALWVFGTCNVSQPSNCALGAENCSLDDEDPTNPVEYVGRWFSEWGEIFVNIPERFRNWNASDFLVYPAVSLDDSAEDSSPALDIMDPGCSACQKSYKNQLADKSFMSSHTVYIMLYPIKIDDDNYKFKNSELITRYFDALTILSTGSDPTKDEKGLDGMKVIRGVPEQESPYYGLNLKLLNRIFTEQNHEGINYQSVFNNDLDEKTASKKIQKWLKEWGLSDKEIQTVVKSTTSSAVEDYEAEVRNTVENKIGIKGIPTMLYNNRKHLGTYK